MQKVRKQIVASADSVNSQIDTAQGKLNETKNAVDTANGKISDAKAQLESAASQVGSAQNQINAANNQLGAARSTIDSAVGTMRSAANTARNAGDTATADALENAANTLASKKPSDASAISASISAEGLSTIDYTAPDLSGAKIDTSKIPSADVKIDVPDINALSTSLKAIQNKYESIVEAVNKLDLKGMQKQLG